jgi:glyoxylase-like metal-dependent hydrolase (beta-lactamase superfamily II)
MAHINRFRVAARFLVSLTAAAVLLNIGGPAFGQVDFSGEWVLATNEDPGQPPLGDYLGIPLNDAGRMRAETTAESIWGIPEFQCRPHSPPHQWRGAGGVRIMKEIDPLTRDLTAYHVQLLRSMNRPIFLDGRPHPPAWAPHTWSGFSTGKWAGSTLVVTTTHLKDGYLKRSGPQTSDAYTMTEYITRNGDYLTVVTIVDDPIYLSEPFVQTTTFRLNVLSQLGRDPCTLPFDENADKPHSVPHYLPGQNTYLTEWLKEASWIPADAARGGAETTYPEYRLKTSASKSAPSPASGDRLASTLFPNDGKVHVLPVQGNVYMLIVDGFNIAASVGPDGVMLVDTGTAQMSDKVLESVKQLAAAVMSSTAPNRCTGMRCPGIPHGWSSPFIHTVISSPAPPKPLRYIINTSVSADRIGGNGKLAPTGFFYRGGGGAAGNFAGGVGDDGAAVIAHENVLLRMSAAAGDDPAAPQAAWPTDTYWRNQFKLHQHFNGEPIFVYHAPAAHTDGDSIAFFRGSEVISAGNLFWTTSYPLIDLKRGGSIQGIIDGLNRILDLGFAENMSQGGTWIIPGRGRLSDIADVASYRNMLTMIRDRIQDMIAKGMTLDQVKRARPTMDFDGRYGSAAGSWTTDMFLEAVYKSLKGSTQ